MLTYKTTNYKSADQYERPLMKRTQIQYYVVIDLLNTGKILRKRVNLSGRKEIAKYWNNVLRRPF